jgi:PAS domain S-box-containing protein
MPAMTLRWHLMALVLAVLLPMIAFSSIVIVTFGREQTAAVQRGAVGTARATMSAIDEYLTGSIRTLEALSALPSLDAGDLRQFHEDAARARSSQPAWLTISLFSPEGRQLVNVLRPVGASLPAVAERRSFDAVVATRRPVMGDLASRELSGQPDFAIRVPVVRRGALVYVLTAVVKPASLLDVLTRQALPEDWVGTIFDGDKKIVARTKNLEAFLARPVSPEFGALLDAGGREGWAVTHTLEGLPVNTAFVRSSISGWGVGLGLPATSVAAPLRRSLLAMIGGGIALTGLALLGALLVGRRIVLPLMTLGSAAKAFGEKGHLPADRHAGVAEIEDLRRAFVHAATLRERADVNARRLAAIVESSDDAIIGKTLQGLVTSWNSAAARMFGYTEAEAVGRPIAFIVPPSRLDEEADILRRLARGEAVEAFETVRRHKDGHSIDVALSISPIRDGAGTITGASTIARDIGPQKRAEAERTALLSAERRAREAAEASEREASFLADVTAVLGSSLDYDTTLARVARLAIPVLTDLCAIDLLEPDGRTRRVAAAHVDPAKEALVAAVRAVHGFNSDAPHGVPAVIRTRRPTLVTSATEADLAAAARDPEQLTMFHKLGLKSWIIVPLIAREQILGAMTFVITESSRRYNARDVALAEAVANRAAVAIDNARLLAAERRARGEAEAANRAKDEFLAVLSHELRTPLNAVYGWARMLRAGQVPAEATERGLEAIVRNANAQVQLIDDLLDISRVITGKMRLDVRSVDLRTVIEAALDSVRPAAVAKDIRVQTVLDPRAGPITGDPDRLQQVVWNLLMNAVKFTPRGGRVQVHLQRVNSHVEIVVSDTGLGMSADVLPFIFDRFRQGDSSSTRVHTGLGLGLALVKHLVELHGGDVTAQSPGQGKGATFIVTLPLTIAEISAGPAPREHPTAASLELPTLVTRLDGVRVLVVDDDRDALDLASAILSQAGAVVKTCSSASEALQAFPQWRPDVLVSDIEMPGEDGYALIRKIRALESERTGKTPAVALTAYGRVQDRMLALTAGFNMHVPKPVDPGELTTIIASLAARAPQPSGS